MNSPKDQPVVIIAGPTASGKSALALELAAAFGGAIINADSQQIYRDLPILSARPDAAATRRVPHRLYGFLDAAERGSVAIWRDRALVEIATVREEGRLPFLVGGTGLYLRALQRGLAPVPAIPAATRAEAAELYAVLGGTAFRERLAEFDPAAASRLPAGDRQRLLRAWEVVRATGRSIGEWQRRVAKSSPGPAPLRFATILIMPPREVLYAACDRRFAMMIGEGALEEAATLAARAVPPDLPAMKGVGVPELLRHLRGEISLDDAITLAQRATRRYAKRQMTWFRHQIVADRVFDQQFSAGMLRQANDFIAQFLLTHPA
jgi:tRNA dimethylallyltransferase